MKKVIKLIGAVVACCLLVAGLAFAGMFNSYPVVTTAADGDLMVIWKTDPGAVKNISIDSLRTVIMSSNVDLSLTTGKILYGVGNLATEKTLAEVSIVTEGTATGGIILGDSTPDANGEIGYASNAFVWFANSEDLTVTASSDMWTFASNTGAAFTFTPAVTVTGKLTPNGGVAALTPVIDDPDNFAANFTGANLYGGTFIANAAGTAALPAVAVGMYFTVVLETTGAVILNPDGTGTADTIYMNGLAAASDENITSSTRGAICTLQYRAADTWMATCNGFVEATPP